MAKPAKKKPTVNTPKKPVKRNFTILCKRENKITRVEGVTRSSFKCPVCGDTVVYLADERRLGGHGVKKDVPTHELRKVSEVGTADPLS